MNVLNDLRQSLRQIFKNPGFFAVAVAALALGIGANTAIFSVVEAVLLRPLPYFRPDLLVMVWEDSSFIGFPNNTPAPANYMDWKAQNTVFSDMAARQGSSMSLTGDGVPEQLFGQRVTPNFFDVLGVQPAIGRAFTPEEDKAKEQVVLLSYSLWQRRFGGDQSAVGRAILLNNTQTKVLGVMPKGFFFREKNVDYWTPLSFTPEQWAQWGNHFLNVVARLKPGDPRKKSYWPAYMLMSCWTRMQSKVAIRCIFIPQESALGQRGERTLHLATPRKQIVWDGVAYEAGPCGLVFLRVLQRTSSSRKIKRQSRKP